MSGFRINALLRKRLNRGLVNLPTYHEHVPFVDINAILEKEGVLIIQEDNTSYSGIFCGAEGSATIGLAYSSTAYERDGITFYKPLTNAALVISWYKMHSGKYEIVSYIS